MSPYDGAREIWERLAEDDAPYPQDLTIFVGLASEWQDHEQHRPAYERDVVDEARRLLERQMPSTGEEP